MAAPQLKVAVDAPTAGSNAAPYPPFAPETVRAYSIAQWEELMLGILMRSPRRRQLTMIVVGLLCTGLGVALFWSAVS